MPTTSVVETPSTAASSSSKPAGDQWGGTAFHADQDGKMAAKFRKLMGMKPGEENPVPEEEEANEAQMKKQDELFQQLDKEYEFARMTTHTHRGIGLGFQSQGLPPYKWYWITLCICASVCSGEMVKMNFIIDNLWLMCHWPQGRLISLILLQQFVNMFGDCYT